MSKPLKTYSDNFKNTDGMDLFDLMEYLEYISFRLRGIASAVRTKREASANYYRMGDREEGENQKIEVRELNRRSMMWRAERQRVQTLIADM